MLLEAGSNGQHYSSCAAPSASTAHWLALMVSTASAALLSCNRCPAIAGSWCGCVTHFSLAARHLSSLQPLEPLLQPHLTHLSLQGVNLVSEGCHARELVNLLLQHCPALEHLGLQVNAFVAKPLLFACAARLAWVGGWQQQPGQSHSWLLRRLVCCVSCTQYPDRFDSCSCSLMSPAGCCLLHALTGL